MEPEPGPGAAPCDECPAQLLREYLSLPVGLLFQMVVDLDFAIQAGIQVRLSEISYPVFLLLRQLTEERSKFEQEQIKAASRRP